MQIRLNGDRYWDAIMTYSGDSKGYCAGWLWYRWKPSSNPTRWFLHLYAIPQHVWFNVDIAYVLGDALSELEIKFGLRIFNHGHNSGMCRLSITTANKVGTPMLEISDEMCVGVCNWLQQAAYTLTEEQAARCRFSRQYNERIH